MGLVVKSWLVSETPVDEQGNLVVIKCRQEGLVSFVLALIGIDPVTTLIAHPDRIEFVQASLNGVNRRVIPLSSVSLTFYGFHKPLKQVLAFLGFIFFFSMSIALAAAQQRDGGAIVVVIGIVDLVLLVGAIVYYFLNKKVTLGIVEVAGAGFGAMIQFKRSLIEGQKVGEPEARKVCGIVQKLVEAKIIK